ncbi:acyl-CoA dehydrogenase family protein, partial [Aeromonas veronii]|nr:acyl-CoA dehydrogenase family protein [Aeromonas veronii]
MSEMQEIINETISKIYHKYSTKEVINNSEEGIWAAELWNQLKKSGMITIAIPERLGGSGGDFYDALSILQLSGKYSAPIPIAESFIANWTLSNLGKEIYSDDIVTICHPDNSSILNFNRIEEGWSISGRVKNVPWARYANKVL